MDRTQSEVDGVEKTEKDDYADGNVEKRAGLSGSETNSEG